jgi:hypothetical protein
MFGDSPLISSRFAVISRCHLRLSVYSRAWLVDHHLRETADLLPPPLRISKLGVTPLGFPVTKLLYKAPALGVALYVVHG